jgi:hypothetical protein
MPDFVPLENIPKLKKQCCWKARRLEGLKAKKF